MSKDRLDAELKIAMREKDQLEVSVVRVLRSAVKYREIELMRSLGNPGVEGVVASDVKRRRDSVEQYRQGGREVLVKQKLAGR